MKEQAKRLKIEQKLEDVMRDSGKQKRTVQRKIQKIREKKQQEYKKRDKEVQTKRNVSLITPNSTRQGYGEDLKKTTTVIFRPVQFYCH